MRGVAFCPAHVTGFFKAQLDEQNLKTNELGSLGAGFSIQDGVTTTVEVTPAEKFDFKITTKGYTAENTSVSEFVVNDFIKRCNSNYFINVHHEILVPVGYGLGSSGAVALSLAVALNKALNLNLSKEKVGQIAHNAEVMCKTGLGDVLASFHGGFEIRTKAGAPGIGVVEKIDSDSNVILICFSPISTKKFITEKIETINGLGGKMVNQLRESRDYNDFQDMSIKFSKYVQVMTPKMELVVNDLHNAGIKCGVALFGETIFTMIPHNMEQKVLDVLKKYNDGIIIKSRIDNSGVRLE
ncbi:MAG: pantoate kinase [Nitrosopumilaceae archaeon]